jgi:hypothetical protein
VLVFIIGAAAARAAGGCATVQPWERGHLADTSMVFDADGSQVAYITPRLVAA